MTQVFISYSRKDLSFVERLVTDLRNAGLDAWYDVSSLGGGSQWRIEIEKAIRNNQLFIAVLSPDSVASEWVEREFLFASNLKRKIVPVMCRSCDLSLEYLNLNYIDMRGKKYKQGFESLLKALAVEPESLPLPDTKIKRTSFGLKNKYAIAVVAALLVLIFAVLLNSPLFESRAEPTPTMTATLTPTQSATATKYSTSTPIVVVVTSTEVTPTFTLTPTPENTATASPSPEPEIGTMMVVLQSSVDEGKAPLKVNFDARTSYVAFADGSSSGCGMNRFCSYDFTVYRDSRFVEKISNNTGTLSYTFPARGTYFVTVYVCRGQACEDDGVTVNVK